jgi:phosphoribosylformimino-5-aminoimidazole carboxamide ribotide isomerase
LTYAGGARTVEDLDLVKDISKGRVDLTIGSALDVFGGSGAKFEDCVAWNLKNS